MKIITTFYNCNDEKTAYRFRDVPRLSQCVLGREFEIKNRIHETAEIIYLV